MLRPFLSYAPKSVHIVLHSYITLLQPHFDFTGVIFQVPEICGIFKYDTGIKKQLPNAVIFHWESLKLCVNYYLPRLRLATEACATEEDG